MTSGGAELCFILFPFGTAKQRKNAARTLKIVGNDDIRGNMEPQGQAYNSLSSS